MRAREVRGEGVPSNELPANAHRKGVNAFAALRERCREAARAYARNAGGVPLK
jgi:hypothetical protein